MFTKTISAGLVALLATSVSAQTHSACKPTEKDCPPAPALGKSITIDYTQGADKSNFFNIDAGTTLEYDGGNGAVFKITGDGQAPTLVSKQYIFFGRVDVELKAAPGKGIVTSVVLQSDDLDEIDWEWVGGDNAQVQTNYFSKGDDSTYDRGAFHAVTNPLTEYHTYTIDWTKDSVKWIINGAVVRELKYTDAKGGATFPQTPCQIRLGTWVAGGKNNAPGTVQWAGGYTNFAEGPFKAFYKSVKVTDYATGATSYVYGDRSGTYKSIVVKTDGSSDSSSSSSSSASPSSLSLVKPSSSKTSSGSSSSSTSTSGSSNSNSTMTSSGPTSTSTSSTGGSSNSGTTGTTAGAAGSTNPSAPSSGVATLPNFVVLGAAAVLSYLVL
jgi:beta-glucanase (GH16 family)